MQSSCPGVLDAVQSGDSAQVAAAVAAADVSDLFERDSSTGWTALHWAAYRGDCSMLELLLSAGLEPLVDARDQHGFTAIHLSASGGHFSVTRP